MRGWPDVRALETQIWTHQRAVRDLATRVVGIRQTGQRGRDTADDLTTAWHDGWALRQSQSDLQEAGMLAHVGAKKAPETASDDAKTEPDEDTDVSDEEYIMCVF